MTALRLVKVTRAAAWLGAVAAALTSLSVRADEGWQVSGALRLRQENIDGQPRAQFNADERVLFSRTSLQARYVGSGWRLVAEVQDSRSWGANAATPLTTNEVNALDLTQAYVVRDFNGALGTGSKLAVQAGRFSMSLGSRRLAASEDYRNTTNTLTGLKVDWQLRGGDAGTAFVTFPVPRLPDSGLSLLHNEVILDRERLETLWYGAQWRAAAWRDGTGLEVLAVGLRDRDAPGRPTRDRNLRTLDLRLIREPAPGRWDWDLEAAQQWGQASVSTAASALPRDVDASFAHLRVGYQWDLPAKPRLALDYDWAGGDGSGPVSHRFDTLYGGRRFDFAPAGLFSLIGRANISSPGLRLELTPSPRLDWMATVRGLWTASVKDGFSTTGIKDASGASGSFAGTQWDTRLRWAVVPRRVQVEVNAVLLRHGPLLRQAPGVRPSSATRLLAVSVLTTF